MPSYDRSRDVPRAAWGRSARRSGRDGGGLSRHELAAAVSEAGGLGTIAVNGAEAIERELAQARTLTGRPIAVNLLLPFVRRGWFEAAAPADVVVTFWGRPKRRVPGAWIHQCGSVGEARAAHAAGADAAIVQGVEAGGHVRGTTPGIELLVQVRAALPQDYPLLLAGGIAERSDAQRALDAGPLYAGQTVARIADVRPAAEIVRDLMP